MSPPGVGALGLLFVSEGGWEAGGAGWSTMLGLWAPWVAALLWLLLVLRGWLRRSRYCAVAVLGPEDCEQVRAAIQRAESATVGEIVPVVVERSDAHPGACWLAAIITLLVGSALAMPLLPFDQPAALLACQIGMGALGWVSAALLPDVKRHFIRESRADHVVHEQALLEFQRLGLAQTRAATGVLLFVSLLERRVVVLGDTGIDAVMGPQSWGKLTEGLLGRIAEGRLAEGLVEAVDACGEVLSTHFPWEEGDRNELPDRLVVRRE